MVTVRGAATNDVVTVKSSNDFSPHVVDALEVLRRLGLWLVLVLVTVAVNVTLSPVKAVVLPDVFAIDVEVETADAFTVIARVQAGVLASPRLLVSPKKSATHRFHTPAGFPVNFPTNVPVP